MKSKKPKRVKYLNKKLCRVKIKNLPLKITDDEIKNYFSKFGPVSKIQLQHKPNGDVASCGFIQFSNQKKAAKAVQESNGKDLMGQKILVELAFKKLAENSASSELSVSSVKSEPDEHDQSRVNNKKSKLKGLKRKPAESDKENKKNNKKKRKSMEQLFEDELENEVDYDSFASFIKTEPVDDKVETEYEMHINSMNKSDIDSKDNLNIEIKDQPKEKTKRKPKISKSKKRCRLIVRNLPFKVTEDILREHFSKYGEISEINLLRKADGKLVGCAFIQYTWKQNAAKAIHCTSGKPLLGRIIIVDWAVSKTQYANNEEKETSANETEDFNNVDVKTESDTDEMKVKIEHDSSDEESDNNIGKDRSSVKDIGKNKVGKKDKSLKSSYKEEKESEDDDGSSHDDESERSDINESGDSDMDESSDEDDNDEISDVGSNKQKKPSLPSDVGEGCTVFVKKIPFSATNDDLHQCMEQFGPVKYALICMDPLTEHSKGSGFVKFKSKESADKCLAESSELSINDQEIEVCRALDKEELQRVKGMKNSKQSRDNRNLYLVKEGVILAGTKAAAGVSATDMAKRLQLEQYKTQMLRNLNMYVSRYRLVVHNIPPSWDNTKLRQLFTKYSKSTAVIREARIMRNMRQVDANGIGKSKEYGFVTFGDHESALDALRHINNNPNIFSANKRPIVAFSIESKSVHNLKQRRLEKSRLKNPAYTSVHDSSDNGGSNVRPNKVRNNINNYKDDDNNEEKEFAGVTAKPGKTKLRSRFNLKTQANIHKNTLKQKKAKERRKKKIVVEKQIKRERIKDSKQIKKSKKRTDEDEKLFNNLVNKYRRSLSSAPSTMTKKWYE